MQNGPRWIVYSSLRTTQAAAYLLKSAGGTCDYDLLVKALYLADWESEKEVHCLMTGILFHHFEDDVWNAYIGRDAENAYLISDPGDHELSPFDEGVLYGVLIGLGRAGRDELSRHIFDVTKELEK